jgi:hypothetical protein
MNKINNDLYLYEYLILPPKIRLTYQYFRFIRLPNFKSFPGTGQSQTRREARTEGQDSLSDSPAAQFHKCSSGFAIKILQKEKIMSDTSFGGWTEFSFTISEEAKTVFDTALKGWCGVGYTPLAFATQVVKGVNYCFLCKAKGVYPDAKDYAVKVYIYQPQAGDPHVTEIKRDQP